MLKLILPVANHPVRLLMNLNQYSSLYMYIIEFGNLSTKTITFFSKMLQ